MKSFLLLTVFSLAAFAQLKAENPRIRLMPPGWKSTAAFVTLKNTSDTPVEIVGASSDFAKTIELHTHKIEDGVMRMREVEKMVVPAKGELVLKPHSDHLMIFGMKEDLKAGSKHDIVLRTADKKEVKITFKTVDMNKGSKKSHKH